MAVKLGEDLMRETGLGVDLSNPQATLFVDILSDRVLLHTSKERGPGGLPVGVTGKVVHLLSGRDRLARGRLAHDEARVRPHLRPLLRRSRPRSRSSRRRWPAC